VVVGGEGVLLTLPPEYSGERLSLAHPEDIARAIREHPEWERVVVALRGDLGFYSGAKQILELLPEMKLGLIPGVSSLAVFAARLGRPWQDFHLVSGHGVDCPVLTEVLNHPRVLFTSGGAFSPTDIVNQLLESGLGEAWVTVGENLTLPKERLRQGKAASLAGEVFSPFSLTLVESPPVFKRLSQVAGIPDLEFVRGEAPLSKRETRALALSLLAPSPGGVFYDIGAGSGSVAVELALAARRGRVYAVEERPEALALIQANRERFGVYNLFVQAGRAPAALAGLPPPEGVFVGGSQGELTPIVAAVLQANPNARLVVAAVTLETLAEANQVMRQLGVAEVSTTSLTVARTSDRAGRAMFTGLNPVFLVSGGGDA
jgi:precorrin-6Y C5,15-methyltransferase (decarboxylating)